MSNTEIAALERLADLIRPMDAYTRGRLVGIAEGMALAGTKSCPDAEGKLHAQEVATGRPKESA